MNTQPATPDTLDSIIDRHAAPALAPGSPFRKLDEDDLECFSGCTRDALIAENPEIYAIVDGCRVEVCAWDGPDADLSVFHVAPTPAAALELASAMFAAGTYARAVALWQAAEDAGGLKSNEPATR
jgi:hypothetical protein